MTAEIRLFVAPSASSSTRLPLSPAPNPIKPAPPGSAQFDTEARDTTYNAVKEYMKEIMGNAGALTKLKL